MVQYAKPSCFECPNLCTNSQFFWGGNPQYFLSASHIMCECDNKHRFANMHLTIPPIRVETWNCVQTPVKCTFDCKQVLCNSDVAAASGPTFVPACRELNEHMCGCQHQEVCLTFVMALPYSTAFGASPCDWPWLQTWPC